MHVILGGVVVVIVLVDVRIVVVITRVGWRLQSRQAALNGGVRL